ncbi:MULTISPECIES: sulfate adenylyltransferase subunit 1 [Caproicibacterium]|uniref:sulfate adenylyltransferase n=1 Tax=Caproicibacterium argilliputei TaxID=3030016 RepID=A0AA97D7E8_9FIRM|nr:GTP-binding protein [Caproicibacterium argilliputei]WOC31714.1 GTP-binding protein [Caproicibacterium argilliputei]
MNNLENGLLKFITCGSVDDGKSTLIGHILYDAKLLYADQEQALLLDSQVGSRGGAIDYSLLLDGLMAEREQGITIDVAYRYFTTERRSFIVADTPGHEEYTRNMAVGASFADLAVILVDASQGVLAQTRRHARICALMGISYFVFAVNKMDLVQYSQNRFAEIVQELNKLCGELKLVHTVYIPVSATEGDNVTRRSETMPWYSGETLLEHLETVDVSSGTPERGFYMPVQRVCRPDHTFRGLQGQVESGTLSVGESLTVLPSGESAVVKSILTGKQNLQCAQQGQAVTVQLDREVDASRGCVLERNADLKTAKEFTAALLWMDDRELVPGNAWWIKLGSKMLPAAVTEIDYRIDVNTGKKLPAQTIVKNGIARCKLVLSEPVVLDEFRKHRTAGAFILIDRVSCATSACGVVEEIGENQREGVFLRDGSKQIQVYLFDRFFYHAELHTVLRYRAKPVVYGKGEKLPLQQEAFAYPTDFDLAADGMTARIRKGVFLGFGNHDEAVLLLDENGIEAKLGCAQSFSRYRKITVGKPERP